MKSTFHDFLLMIQFFTRIPINKNLPASSKNFKRGAVFLPLIGLLIGTLQYIVAYMLQHRLPPSILAAIVTVLPVIITGALHIDGLGDTCDGFFALTDNRARILAIMTDSSSGTFAICAIISNMLLQYVAISHIIHRGKMSVLLVVIMFSKICVMLTAMWGKPAKPQGSGNLFIGNMSLLLVIVAGLYTLFISSLTISLLASLILLFSGMVVSFLFYILCKLKISGITGDTMGATQEIATVVMLIVYSGMI